MISVLTPTTRGKEGLRLVEKALRRQTFQDYEWVIVEPKEKPEGLYWTLYRDYNRGIKKCKGDLIVSWQDCTFSDPDTLEKFYFHYQSEPKTVVTAIGNKYKDDTFMAQTWQDPRERKDQGSFYSCYPNDIELNLASFPKKAFYDVGGFDEELDKYSSLCGLDVLTRLAIIGGYDFKIDQTIRSYSTEHGRLENWEENLPFGEPWESKIKEYNNNPVLNYL
jgi:hypothetical protein